MDEVDLKPVAEEITADAPTEPSCDQEGAIAEPATGEIAEPAPVGEAEEAAAETQTEPSRDREGADAGPSDAPPAEDAVVEPSSEGEGAEATEAETQPEPNRDREGAEEPPALIPDEPAGQEAPPEPEIDEVQLKAVIEAIVYVAEESVTAPQVANALQAPEAVVKKLLEALVADYAGAEHGVMIREIAGGFKLATKPEHHEAVRTFAKSLKPPLKLSLAALETLATIAYKQPVTGPEIMEIRGVQGAGVLKTLLDRKLIQASGRKNVIGRPMLYRTTKEFQVQFGLKDLSELPTLKEFEELRRMAAGEEEEAPAEAVENTPAETEPAEAQAQPVEAQAEPAAAQVEPAEAQAEPAAAQAQPAEADAEPAPPETVENVPLEPTAAEEADSTAIAGPETPTKDA
jgi:segregation and condensation protein B